MKIRSIIFILLLLFTLKSFAQDQYIFPYGGGGASFNLFMKEAIKLTGKEKPRVCFLQIEEAGIVKEVLYAGTRGCGNCQQPRLYSVSG